MASYSMMYFEYVLAHLWRDDRLLEVLQVVVRLGEAVDEERPGADEALLDERGGLGGRDNLAHLDHLRKPNTRLRLRLRPNEREAFGEDCGGAMLRAKARRSPTWHGNMTTRRVSDLDLVTHQLGGREVLAAVHLQRPAEPCLAMEARAHPPVASTPMPVAAGQGCQNTLSELILFNAPVRTV